MSRESSKCYLAHSRIHYNTLVFGGKIHVRTIWGKRVSRGLGRGRRVTHGQQKHRVKLNLYRILLLCIMILFYIKKTLYLYRERFPLKFSFAFITPQSMWHFSVVRLFVKACSRGGRKGGFHSCSYITHNRYMRVYTQ